MISNNYNNQLSSLGLSLGQNRSDKWKAIIIMALCLCILMHCRLQFLDVNVAVAGSDPMPEFNMVLPATDSYKDLHGGMVSQFPVVTIERLQEYLDQYDKKRDAKTKLMYSER